MIWQGVESCYDVLWACVMNYRHSKNGSCTDKRKPHLSDNQRAQLMPHWYAQLGFAPLNSCLTGMHSLDPPRWIAFAPLALEHAAAAPEH